jgi:hypothetical protein
MLAVVQCGQIFGTEARPHVFNKRWRTVPTTPLSTSYDWELRRNMTVAGSPTTLLIFRQDGVKLERTARCPLFLLNYVTLDSPNLQGIQEVFRDNTLYFLDDTTCVLQNTWFTGALESSQHAPYFLDLHMPVMRSYIVQKSFEQTRP